MYNQIVDLVIALGNSLPDLAGQIRDLGLAKKYVTEKDLEIEQALASLIKSFPGKQDIFAEEIYDQLLASDSLWVIDPISNTFNFLHGFPHYAIVVSHIVQGEVRFAVVYDPSVKELFLAKKGEGATLNGKPIQVNTTTNDHCLLYEFSSSKITQDRAFWLMQKLNTLGKTKKSFGSVALHYAYVACGRASAAVTINKDIFPEMAGLLLVQEAGGRVSDFHGQAIGLDTVGVVFSNGQIHSDVLALLQD